MSTRTLNGSSLSSRVQNAAWLSSLFAALCLGAASPQAQPTQQEGRNLGLEPTGNFESPGESVDLLCFAAPLLELPRDYRDLRFRRAPDGECGFDEARWDVFSYRPEAVAGEQVGITPELAAAPVVRSGFVVAHEEFHDQPEVRRLPPGLHEPASTLAAFLIQSRPSDSTDPALLFLRKSILVRRYGYRLSRLYELFRRGEMSRDEALGRKRSLFAALEAECLALPASQEFNRCPAALNNAGLAFDATYTRLYPSMYALFEATGYDRTATFRVLRENLGREPGILRNPRKVLREMADRLLER